jgi:uncharacterized membrane protein
MGPFWKSLGEGLKDRGRNPTVFIIAVAVFFGLTGLIALVKEAGLTQYIMPALPWMGVFAATWAGVAIRRGRERRRERLQRPPLSCDELRAARSKLVKDRNRKGA